MNYYDLPDAFGDDDELGYGPSGRKKSPKVRPDLIVAPQPEPESSGASPDEIRRAAEAEFSDKGGLGGTGVLAPRARPEYVDPDAAPTRAPRRRGGNAAYHISQALNDNEDYKKAMEYKRKAAEASGFFGAAQRREYLEKANLHAGLALEAAQRQAIRDNPEAFRAPVAVLSHTDKGAWVQYDPNAPPVFMHVKETSDEDVHTEAGRPARKISGVSEDGHRWSYVLPPREGTAIGKKPTIMKSGEVATEPRDDGGDPRVTVRAPFAPNEIPIVTVDSEGNTLVTPWDTRGHHSAQQVKGTPKGTTSDHDKAIRTQTELVLKLAPTGPAGRPSREYLKEKEKLDEMTGKRNERAGVAKPPVAPTSPRVAPEQDEFWKSQGKR